MAEESTARSKSLAIGQFDEEPKKFAGKSLTEDPVQTQNLTVEEEEKNELSNINIKNGAGGAGDDGDVPDEEKEIMHGLLYRCLHAGHCRCLARFTDKWPRCASFLFGVLLPLWTLIFISLIFGTWLAYVEAPTEIEYNDASLAEISKLNLMSNLFANISSLAMIFCIWNDPATNNTKPPIVEFTDFPPTFNITLKKTRLEEILAEASDLINDISVNFTPGALDGGVDIYVTVSATRFMECTETVRNLTSIMNVIMARYAMEIGDPTFDWNRCSDQVNDTDFIIPFPDLGRPGDPSYKPEAQRLAYIEAWLYDRDRILDELKQQNPNSTAKADLQMFITASDQATGSETCEPNGVASTWFWFTIMTTMGYGNTSPNTQTGRNMVYTLGFVSLLCFGGVLAYSGFVISSILDDAFRRTKIDFLVNDWFSLLMWGSLAYLWMLVIGQHYVSWRKDRLDDTISLSNGYWFAYISTTTIGLGDFVLEPEVITGTDLLIFPLIILIGFVFFSAFLGKFGDLFTHEEIPSQTLQERLAATSFLLCCKVRRRNPPS